MAVQRRVSWISQQRVDVRDMRAVESAASNDMDQLIQAFVTGTGQGYILRGFELSMAGAIRGAASGLQLLVDPGAVMHIASSQSGTMLMVPSGTAPQQLNSATNTIVDGAFAPSAINYVSIEYERFIDASTSAQVYIWNPTTNNETTKNAPRAQILRYRIKITTSTPATNFLPVATVTTDSGNNVISITDARWMLFRLGQGGPSPNPFYSYPWTAQSEGRTESPSTSTSNSSNPFHGGDKMLLSLKDWMNAVMTSVQEIKGTTYWYSQSSSGSLESLREDLGNTIITGKGSIAHGVSPVDKTTPTAAGQINWDQDVNIRVIGSSLTYKLLANASSTDITLADDHVAYVSLVRGVLVVPNLIFTNGISQVSSVGAISWTASLQIGDYLKLASDTDAGYYQIQSVDSLTQVTLTTVYAGVNTGASGAQGRYAFGSYQTSPAPSTNRDIFISSRATVPRGQDVFWLFSRSDSGGAQPRAYIRLLGAELNQGEDRDVSDGTSAELLKYIGAATVASYLPQFVSALNPGSVPQITSLTVGSAATLTSGQYFLINSSGNSRRYAVWIKKDGVGSQPNVAFVSNYIEWDVTTGQSSTQVATTLKNALNATTNADFTATSGIGTVSVVNSSSGSCTAASNFSVGAPFNVTIAQTGTGTGNFSIKDGDSLTLAIKELDVSFAQLNATLSAPSYDEQVSIVASGATPPTSLNSPVNSGTAITLPNNTRLSNIAQKYIVGNGILEVYLNGQYLTLGVDWTEIGTTGQLSTQITIQQGLVTGDVLGFRIDATGGVGSGGAAGPQGPVGPAGPPGADAIGGPVAISTKNSNYTVANSDNVLLADCAGGSVTFTLPLAAAAVGQVFFFKKKDASVNAMIIQATELIDGLNSQMTTIQYGNFTIVSDGAAWWIL